MGDILFYAFNSTDNTASTKIRLFIGYPNGGLCTVFFHKDV